MKRIMHIGYETMHRRNRNGFTLIELLVVVAIIALLISILLPSLTRARDVARQVTCQTILKQYGAADHMYADASDGWFVTRHINYGTHWLANHKYRDMLGLRSTNVAGGDWGIYQQEPGLVCPDVPEEFLYNPSKNYGANSTELPADPGAFILRAAVQYPSAKFSFLDSADWNAGMWGAEKELYWDQYGHLNGSEGGAWNITAFRHYETANFLYFDNHTDNLTGEQVYPLDDWNKNIQQWDIYGRQS